GQIIEGKYKILALIGRGGIGSVYKAEQLLLKKSVRHAKLLFVTDSRMLEYPAYWGRFVDDDLNGVVIKRSGNVKHEVPRTDFAVIALSLPRLKKIDVMEVE